MSSYFLFYNLGNTCYLNTALQCLYTNTVLCEIFKKPLKTCITVSYLYISLYNMYSFLFNKKEENITDNTTCMYFLQDIYKHYCNKYNIQRHSPEDSLECFIRLIDTCLVYDNDNNEDTSLSVLYSKINNVLTFPCCKHVITKNELFLSLDLCYNTNTSTLHKNNILELLSFFFKETIVYNTECDKCNLKVNILHQYRLIKISPLLLLNLSLGPLENENIEICTEILLDNTVYTLNSIGLYTGGHYLSIVQDRKEKHVYHIISDYSILHTYTSINGTILKNIKFMIYSL